MGTPPYRIYEKLLPINYLKCAGMVGPVASTALPISLLKGNKFFQKSREIS
jgi:hypothetical protein